MLKYLSYSIITIFFISAITRCANVTAPTGGPKDTIPPSMVNSIPLNKSINFKDNTIYLEFDERIKEDKLKDQLIITPVITGKYENTIKKNLFKMTFDEPFADSTTYTLNFREGIQDISESNPSLTNKFTFSTGSFIDSLTVYGLTTNLLNSDTIENAIVGLFRVEDTVNIFNGSPYYFSQTDEKGYYSIENIKNGKYIAAAFTDTNKNLKLDFKSESYAFKKDTLVLDSIPIELNFKLYKLDITPFRQTTALPTGIYYEINFNKYVIDFIQNPIDTTTQKLYANLSKQNKSIRFYNAI
ncbi:MAG: Ig-like domain-containing domain [Cyclobacteriaceae bacterium]|nr:Ig-like domain-containing domain [Cyclobacteriaceae bacterium]